MMTHGSKEMRLRRLKVCDNLALGAHVQCTRYTILPREGLRRASNAPGGRSHFARQEHQKSAIKKLNGNCSLSRF
ncbi:unnamed protein product [Tenebrio molitor]|nr:unnamed protein product [Tenebrio molitor]